MEEMPAAAIALSISAVSAIVLSQGTASQQTAVAATATVIPLESEPPARLGRWCCLARAIRRARMRVVCLVSGGKDSFFSMLEAARLGRYPNPTAAVASYVTQACVRTEYHGAMLRTPLLIRCGQGTRLLRSLICIHTRSTWGMS